MVRRRLVAEVRPWAHFKPLEVMDALAAVACRACACACACTCACTGGTVTEGTVTGRGAARGGC
jgi:hypothetical protein